MPRFWLAPRFSDQGSDAGLTGLKAIPNFRHFKKGRQVRDRARADSKVRIMTANIKPSGLRNGTTEQASYQPQDRVEVQPGMSFNPYASVGQTPYPQAFPGFAGRPERQGRWREYGILLGLWLLVMLVAAVIGMRFLDLSAGAARPDDYGRGTVAPATPAGPPGLPTSRLAEDDDPFDDPLPGLPQAPAAKPAATSTPATNAAAALQLSTGMAATNAQQAASLAHAPAVMPDAPVHGTASGARASVPARVPAACPPALSAMQLCGENEH